MKAAVLGDNGVEVRDLPKPEPKPNEVLIRVRASSLNRADTLVASGHPAWQRRRRRRADRAGMLRRGRGGRQRGEGLQGRRPRHGLGAGRLCRICRHRCRAREPHSRQQHDLRAGGVLSGRVADHAQCGRDRRAIETRRDAADPGRQLRRRPDGHADRQADGRLAGDGNLDQRRAPRRGSRTTAATSRSIRASRTGRRTSKKRPAARASI